MLFPAFIIAELYVDSTITQTLMLSGVCGAHDFVVFFIYPINRIGTNHDRPGIDPEMVKYRVSKF